MKSIAVFLVLFFALFSLSVSAQQSGASSNDALDSSFIIHHSSLISGASNNDALDKQKVKYKVWVRMLAEDRQLESIYTRNVSLYSTGDSSIIVSKNQKWFYPDKIPTEMIPVEQIWEVRAKKRGQVGKSILIGAGIGFFLGGVLGNITYKPCTSNGFECLLVPDSRIDATMTGAFIGGFLLGIPVGAIVGFASGSNTIIIKGNRTTYLKQREKLKRLSITGQ